MCLAEVNKLPIGQAAQQTILAAANGARMKCPVKGKNGIYSHLQIDSKIHLQSSSAATRNLVLHKFLLCIF